MTNEDLEACCDTLEKERQRLSQDPATRQAAMKLQEVLNDLSKTLAHRDGSPQN